MVDSPETPMERIFDAHQKMLIAESNRDEAQRILDVTSQSLRKAEENIKTLRDTVARNRKCLDDAKREVPKALANFNDALNHWALASGYHKRPVP